jgi:hypothetical protein
VALQGEKLSVTNLRPVSNPSVPVRPMIARTQKEEAAVTDMEKSRFVAIAHLYYALAVAEALRTSNWTGPLLKEDILSKFSVTDDNGDPEDPFCYLGEKLILDRAIAWMVENELVQLITDDYGPTMYKITDQWDVAYRQIREDRDLPFIRYHQASDKNKWLLTALKNLNLDFHRLEIQQEDFDEPDRDWEPIPLDRRDAHLQQAISALDETIEQVRADNGYNANLPEERNYVLAGLMETARVLKTATSTSLPFVRKYALDPLTTLIRRFKGAAMAIVATGARDAIVEFIKQHGIKILEYLIK